MVRLIPGARKVGRKIGAKIYLGAHGGNHPLHHTPIQQEPVPNDLSPNHSDSESSSRAFTGLVPNHSIRRPDSQFSDLDSHSRLNSPRAAASQLVLD
jgi:hypothetical protein